MCVCARLQLEASLEQLRQSLEAVKLDRAAVKPDLKRCAGVLVEFIALNVPITGRRSTWKRRV